MNKEKQCKVLQWFLLKKQKYGSGDPGDGDSLSQVGSFLSTSQISNKRKREGQFIQNLEERIRRSSFLLFLLSSYLGPTQSPQLSQQLHYLCLKCFFSLCSSRYSLPVQADGEGGPNKTTAKNCGASSAYSLMIQISTGDP